MVAFLEVNELKDSLLAMSANDFFDAFVLGVQSHHFGPERIDFVCSVLLDFYGVEIARPEVVVVGSSKIGFALHPKYKDGVKVADPFRAFGPESDIDLSVCSPKLFSLLWHELSEYLYTKGRVPVRTQKLGDYLTYGWLRQDKLPPAEPPYLILCDNLRFARGRIRGDRMRGHPKVNLGIFYDLEHLRLYQTNGITRVRAQVGDPL